jgi:AcrR family transcriptional regulator
MAVATEDRAVEVQAPPPGGVPVRGRGASVRSKRSKSEITHSKLCQATARLLDMKPLRMIKVSDITQVAAVAPSTFYIYFADVDEAVLAAIAEIQTDLPELDLIIDSITAETLEARIKAFVKGYIGYWDEHFALLRTRNLAADEGEPRFKLARARMVAPTLAALERKLIELRGSELAGAKVAPGAVAALIVGQMERLAAIIRNPPATQDLTRRKLIDAAVFTVCDVMRGGTALR